MIQHPLRSNDIRESNEKLVLNLIFRNGGTSQSQVVQQTGLKAPTVFRIFAKLEQEGLIQSCPQDDIPDQHRQADRKGRRPNYYCVEPASGYAVGVDFSSVAASVIVVDFSNQVIHNVATELEPDLDRDQILALLNTLISEAISSSGIDAERIIGIGIAAPGVVDTVTGTVLEYERITGLSGYSIGEHFSRIFTVPVYVHNNASVIASSAYHYGSARDERSLLAVLVRSGVGGALVNHGQIFLNGTATALEVGRINVLGVEDGAGPTRNLESVCAEPVLLGLLREHFGVNSWREIQERLSLSEIWPVLSDARNAFGTTVHNLHHIFHPEAILLICRFPLLAEFLGAVVREALPQQRVISMVYDPVQACYGATDIVFKHFFNVKPGQPQEAVG